MAGNTKAPFTVKRTVVFNGQSKRIQGYSEKSKKEALLNFDKNVEKWKASLSPTARLEGRTFESEIMIWNENFLKQKSSKGRMRSEATIHTDEDTIKQLCQAFGKFPCLQITAETIQKYFNKLAADHSNSIINKQWHMLNMFCRYLRMSTCGAFTNPMEICMKPESKIEKPEKISFTEEEVNSLIQELSTQYAPGTDCGYMHGKAIIFAIYEALRIAELTELRVKDIDDKWIHITRQYYEPNRHVKNPKFMSARDVPIVPEVREILNEAMFGKKQEDLLFSAKSKVHHGHILQDTLRRELRRACVRSLLGTRTMHDLRHEGISRLIRKLAPEDFATLSKWVGHKELTTTLNVYYRETKTEENAAFKRITESSIAD